MQENFNKQKNKKAFTLAEVIIVISILGVIATLTIGRVIPSVQEKNNLVRLKKVYAQLENSYETQQVYEGPVVTWGIKDVSVAAIDKNNHNYSYAAKASSDAARIMEMIIANVKYRKVRIPFYSTSFLGNLSVQESQKKAYENKNVESITRYELKDGALLSGVWIYSTDCTTSRGQIKNVCGEIFVDVNGSNGPNIFGRDIFVFYFTQNGIIPMGRKGDSYSLASYCDRTQSTKQYNGYGCTAWALDKGNMDYLRKNVRW